MRTADAMMSADMDTPPLILVCDDEMHIRAMISMKLRAAGFEVVEARNGEEGLAIAAQRPPKLVITDFQMPVMSGIEMAASLRKNSVTNHTPVLMLTARGYVLSLEQLATTNIREVLPKPFGVQQLLLKVRAILGGSPDAMSAGEKKPLAA